MRDLQAREYAEARLGVGWKPCLVLGALDRPDPAIRGVSTGPKPSKAWDVTAAHPLRLSSSQAARVTPSVSASEAEGLKLGNAVSRFCAPGPDFSFRPLAFETTGAWGKHASAGVKALAARVALCSAPTAGPQVAQYGANGCIG